MTDTTLVHERPGTATATTAVTGRHLPALNGLRGVAVIGVVAYHLQIGGRRGDISASTSSSSSPAS